MYPGGEFEGNWEGAGLCSITFSLESECARLFQRGGNFREMGPKHVCPISFHVIGWLLTYVLGQGSNKSNRPQSWGLEELSIHFQNHIGLERQGSEFRPSQVDGL